MSTATLTQPEILDGSIEDIELKHRAGCIKGCLLGQNEVNGHVILVPLCCKSWNCPACAVRLTERWMDVAVRGQPERFLTLTGDPALHPDPHDMAVAIKNAWAKFVAHWRRGKVRKDGKHTIPPHTLEYVAVWELHKSGYPHLHILQRGDYIPQPYLRRWMMTAKVGQKVDIRHVDDPRKAAVEVIKYVTKAAGDVSGALTHLRIITKSRKYDPHDIYAVSDNTTPGYEWCRLPISADLVLEYLIQQRGWSYAPCGGMRRMELVPSHDDLCLVDLAAAISSDLDLPRSVYRSTSAV